MRHRRCISAILMSFVLFLQPVYAVPPEENQPENSQENNTENEKRQQEQISAPSAILMEASTGQIIYEKNPDEKLPPASVTKVMTLLLIFDALESGQIKLADEVTTSEYAASMGGSQVFLEPGETQTVDTLIKCISVASANDACVAMSEYIAGTESAFVAKMNERATGLGMNNTNFVNCCGLDTDGHMSTARDIALMSRELITKYPQIHDYSTIWMDTIIHSTRRGDSEFGLTNTNKLIKQYEWATGLKTGSTGLAKCCLSASANKDGIDLIAVIMAAPDSKTRFAEAVNLLNYGFNTCDIYKDDGMPLLENIRISKGKKDYVNCRYEKEFSYMFINPVNHEDISKELHINENIAAPVYEGDTIGTLEYYYNGEKIGSVNVISSENIEKADFLTQIKKVLGRLLK